MAYLSGMSPPPQTTVPDQLELDHCTVDLVRGRIQHEGGRTTSLSTVELQLLRFLVGNGGASVSRYELLEEVWGYDSSVVISRAADTAVCRLRRKLERDPAEPRYLLTVSGVGYRWVSPTPGVPDAPSHTTNLWSDPGAFVGRSEERAWLRTRIGDGGGVSVLRGFPGIGKTRLAVQVGQELVEGDAPPGGGVWFCDLAGARSLMDLLDAIAWVLDVPVAAGGGEGDALERVAAALSARGATVLLLDNAEHVDGPLHVVVPRLLAAAPDTHVVVTTQHRTRLGEGAERVLSPLPPDASRALLADRARLAGAAAPVGDDALDEVVGRLQGVPLALELAAPQLRVLAPGALAERLDRGGLALPVSGRGGPGGGTSLRRAIGFAWDLLDDDSQKLLAACSLFDGGFSRRAVEGVSGAGSDTAARLDQLVDRSLVVAVTGEDGAVRRYQLLDSIRAFARAQLPELSLEEPLRERHARWFAEQAARWAAGMAGPDGVAHGERLHAERSNLLTAWRWLRPRDRVASIRLAVALVSGARLRGATAEHLVVLEAAAQDAAPEAPALRATVLEALAWYQRSLGQADEAMRSIEAAVAAAREHGDPGTLALMLAGRADHQRLLGQQQVAEEGLREALFAAARAGAPHTEARVRATLGLCLAARGAFQHAEESLELALDLFRACGDLREQGVVWSHLAALAGRRWRHTEAAGCYARALEIHLQTGNLHHASVARLGLAMRRIDAGEAGAAVADLEAVLERETRTGNRRLQGFALAGLASAAHDRGDLTRARTHLAAAAARFAGHDRLHVAAADATRAVLDIEQGDLDAARAGLGASLVALETIGDRSLQAFAEGWLGVVLADVGDLDASDAAFERAAACAREAGMDAQLALQEIQRGFLDLARSRATRDGAAAARHRAKAEARARAGEDIGTHLRIARRMLQRRLAG